MGRTSFKTAGMMVAALLLPFLAGCDGFPRDIAGTSEEIKTTGILRAGIVAGDSDEAKERAWVEKIAETVGADADIKAGSAATLLHELEEGRIDLVMGQFAKASPWKTMVAFTDSPEADAPRSHVPVLRAAVRNGENRWLMLVSETLKKEHLR